MCKLLLPALLLASTAFAQEPSLAPPLPPVRIAGGVIAGNILTKVNPSYPREAKEKHIQGSVILRAIIAKDGTIQNLTLISGNQVLADAALEAVSQWTYRPYLLNGEPTEVDTTITVNFTFGSAPVPAATPAALLHVSEKDLVDSSISKVAPHYPAEAKKKHITGTVELDAVIGTDGTVQSVTPLSGPPLLVEAAVTAAHQWRYRPYLVDGVPTAIATNITIHFEMAD